MTNVRTIGFRRQIQDTLPHLFPELAEGQTGVLAKNITFVVTEGCPLRCSYCYECHKDQQARMTKDIARAGVDLILSPERTNGFIDLNKDKLAIIEFIGGEPLLESELMLYITRYFKQQVVLLDHPWKDHFMFSITSNGIPYKEPAFAQLLRENPSRVSVSVTVDGDKRLHDSCRVYPDGRGSYDDAVAAVDFIRGFLPLKATKSTLAPGNIQYVSQSIPHLFALGFTDVNCNVVYEEGWTIADSQLLYKELIKLADWMIDTKTYETSFCSIFDQSIGQFQGAEHTNNWCGGTGQMLAIGTDGRLWPCIRYMPYSISNPRPEMSIGTVWDGIDRQSDCLSCMACITRQTQSTQECLDCPVSSGCGWCSAYNYDYFGTPDKRCTFTCWPHRARCMASAYYWSKIKEVTGVDVGAQDNVEPLHRAIILGEAPHGMQL